MSGHLRQTFRSLVHRDYRLWLTAALVSNVGTWMQRIAQDWLVLVELTDDSAAALGLITTLQFLPMLLLAPWAGLAADRFERRRVLQVTQSAQGLLALGLGALVLTGSAQVWHVAVFAGLLGVVTAFDAPARQTYVTGLVPPADIPNAIGLNSTTFHLGRLLGPATAGFLIAWLGTGPVFVVNAVSFAGTVLVLGLTRSRRPGAGTGGRSGLARLRQGLGYVRTRPDLQVVFALVLLSGLFAANLQLTTALMARLELDRGPEDFGLLGSALAVGAVTGALLAAGRSQPRLRLVVGATAALGLTSLASAVMPSYLAFAASLALVGVSSLTLMTSANATVQLSTPPELRGRVVALYFAVFLGAVPLGAPLVSWLSETAGARWAIAAGGLVALAAVGAALVWLAATGRWGLLARPAVPTESAAATGTGTPPGPTEPTGPIGPTGPTGAAGVVGPKEPTGSSAGGAEAAGPTELAGRTEAADSADPDRDSFLVRSR